MTLMSDAECNASLGRRYGANRTTTGPYAAPDQIDIELWAGDPRGTGVQMDLVGGYTPAVVDNDGTTWPDAPADRQIISAATPWTPTGEWTAGGDPVNATYWLIRNHDTGDEMDCMPIGYDIAVLDAGDAFALQFKVSYVPVVADA